MDVSPKALSELKQALTASLERKGVLAKVKAELRAHVFEAVQQKDGAGSNRRRSVSDLPRGALMASLVAEYLEWSGCDYAARVFAAEIGEVDVGSNRSRDALARELGLRDAVPDAPLLHALLGRSRTEEIPGAGVRQETPAPTGSTAVPPLPSLAAIKRPAHADRGAVTMSDDDESAEIEEDISIAASDGGLSAGGRSPPGGGAGLSPRDGPMPAGVFGAADVSGSIDGMDETVDVVEGAEGGVGDVDGGRPKTAEGGRRR
uniref:FGFR1 oncogene partner (FOP) N-terminal dimerisation domain-containing protein n=1 Tax=Micromonas pusilla TaxID=38833 RepID=A0A7S0IEH7_MICPS